MLNKSSFLVALAFLFAALLHIVPVEAAKGPVITHSEPTEFGLRFPSADLTALPRCLEVYFDIKHGDKVSAPRRAWSNASR